MDLFIGQSPVLVTTIAFITATTAIVFLVTINMQSTRKQSDLERKLDRTEMSLRTTQAMAAKIKKELELNTLTKAQMQLIKNAQSSIKKEDPKAAKTMRLVGSSWKIDWKKLKFIARIGSGSFGDAYKGRYCPAPGEKEDLVAIKRIRSGLVDANLFKAFQREVLMLSTVKHPSVVAFRGYSTHPQLLIVLEFVEGGDLSTHLEREAQNPFEAKTSAISIPIILQDIAEGVTYLHNYPGRPILHRDIKTENILLTNEMRGKVSQAFRAREEDCSDGRARLLLSSSLALFCSALLGSALLGSAWLCCAVLCLRAGRETPHCECHRRLPWLCYALLCSALLRACRCLVPLFCCAIGNLQRNCSLVCTYPSLRCPPPPPATPPPPPTHLPTPRAKALRSWGDALPEHARFDDKDGDRRLRELREKREITLIAG